MKFSPFVALFLIWVIPVKPIHADSQAELHWGAKGSGRPPKISQLIDKSHSRQLIKKSPLLDISIDQSPVEKHRSKPIIPRLSGNFRGSSKLDNSGMMHSKHIHIFSMIT